MPQRAARPWYSVSREFATSLAIFLATLLVLAFIFARGMIIADTLAARKSVLKEDLQTMRQAIDNYTLDKQRPPQALQDLVDAHYLRAVPVDPITRATDWQLHFANVSIPPNLVIHGIDDVHSASTKTGSSDDTRYDTW